MFVGLNVLVMYHLKLKGDIDTQSLYHEVNLRKMILHMAKSIIFQYI